jgi:hypothetical protein
MNAPANLRRKTRRHRDWPALMRESTARDYLDGLSAVEFRATVAPFLVRKMVGGEVRYTRESLDDWIDRGNRPGALETPADLARALDDDRDQA